MCLKSPKAPTPPPVQNPPNRDTVASATQDARRRSAAQQSTYGQIFTSVLGDSNYGANVQSQRPQVAALGA